MLEYGQFKTIYDDEMHFCAGTRLAASPVGRLVDSEVEQNRLL